MPIIAAQKEQERHRARHAAQERERRLRNPEAFNAARRTYYATTRERRKAQLRASYARHSAQRRAEARRYYFAHLDEKKAYAAAFRLTHAVYLKEYYLAWSRINKDKVHQKHQIRKARKHGAHRITLSPAQWEEIKHAYKHCCAYCGRRMQRLEKDHITPAIDHGDYHVHNIVPACRTCNARKGTKPPPKPVQPLLLTIAEERKPRKRRAS